jgi:hypothetical protein
MYLSRIANYGKELKGKSYKCPIEDGNFSDICNCLASVAVADFQQTVCCHFDDGSIRHYTMTADAMVSTFG